MADDTVGGEEVVVFWQAGTVSPLDSASTASGHDVGATAAFSQKPEFISLPDSQFERLHAYLKL